MLDKLSRLDEGAGFDWNRSWAFSCSRILIAVESRENISLRGTAGKEVDE